MPALGHSNSDLRNVPKRSKIYFAGLSLFIPLNYSQSFAWRLRCDKYIQIAICANLTFRV